MKRYKDLYVDLLNKDLIKKIIIESSKGKTHRKEVQLVLSDINSYVNNIYQMLVHDDIQLKPTKKRVIKEKNKFRDITISPFYPNQILDYLMTYELKKIITKGMYKFNCGNIDGRGIHYGKRYIEKHIKEYRYCAKLDVHKFYPSVKKTILIRLLETKIKDYRFIKFVNSILIGDGLNIGNYSSQWLSNFYLQGLDHYIKEELKISVYCRYVDDMVLISNNKRKLHQAIDLIKEYLGNLQLELNPNYQVFEIDKRGIDFLGYKFFRKKTKIRKSIFLHLFKKIRRIKKKKHCCYSQAVSIISLIGWLKNIQSFKRLYERYIKSVISLEDLKNIISNKSIKGELKNEY